MTNISLSAAYQTINMTATTGINGTNGTHGISHTNGTNGHTNGGSYANGTNGTSHTNGTNGTNGHTNGHTNGDSHANGTNGTNGVHVENTNDKAVPIAICGMGLRLPGGSSTPQEFWEFLVNKGDARGRVPKSRYNVSAYHETSKRPTTVATEYGYFLDEDVKLGAMDTTRFSMSRADVEYADPQQRRLLEVVTEAFEDAGEAKFRVNIVFPAFHVTTQNTDDDFRARKLDVTLET